MISRQEKPEPRPTGSPIDAAKEMVPVVDLADLLCGPGKMRRVNDRWIAKCPLPDHADRTPSFTVYPETNSWYCYGCLRGGSVIDLGMVAWDYDEPALAAAYILHEFGHPIPERPDSWYDRQRRQKPIRDSLDEMRVERVRRRLMRWIVAPELATIPEPEERRDEAKIAWDKLLPIARQMVAHIRDEVSG